MVIGTILVTTIDARAESTKVYYRYPVYKTDGVAASGINYWVEDSFIGTDSTISESYTVVTDSSDSVTWNTGWYVATGSDVEITSSVTVSGNVNLILADGCSLTIKSGIKVINTDLENPTNTLTIYAGSTIETITGTGTLNATADIYDAGIGGGEEGNGSNITINGGIVTAKGGFQGGAGIGGGKKGNGSNITINGGTVTATGGSNNGGAGIGGGQEGNGSNITINGGIVTANGGVWSAGIGGGMGGNANGGNGSNITINGGTITATGGTYSGGTKFGAGIGGGSGLSSGSGGSGSDITINGGKVTAKSDGYGAGIGGGGGGVSGGSASNITIKGGIVTATGGSDAIGIGAGYNANSSNIKIEASIVVKAGDSENPTKEIEHDDNTDLATIDDFKKQYVTAVKDYTITFDSNGGSGSMDSMTTINQKLTLPANDFIAPAGKLFEGWSIGSATADAMAPGLELDFSADTTIYAKWIDKTTPEINDFTFVVPSNLDYDGTAKIVTITGKEGMGTITIKYAASLESDEWVETAPINAGTYYVKISIAEGTSYIEKELTDESWKFTILQKVVTITADDISVTYGEKDPELTATVDGLVGTDTVEYTVSRTAGEDAGAYTITVQGEASQGNYSITFITGTFTINPKNDADVNTSVDDLAKIQKEYQDKNPGKDTIVQMSISKNANVDNIALIQAKAGTKKLTSFELNLIVIVGGDAVEDAGNTNTTLVTTTYSFDFTKKSDIQVFRLHDTNVDELTETANSNGEYVIIDSENGTITVVASKYSTYSFAYNEVTSDDEQKDSNPKEDNQDTSDTTDTKEPVKQNNTRVTVLWIILGIDLVGLIAVALIVFKDKIFKKK